MIEFLIITVLLLIVVFSFSVLIGKHLSHQTRPYIKPDLKIATLKLWSPAYIRAADPVGVLTLPDGTKLDLQMCYDDIEIQVRRRDQTAQRFQEGQERVDTDYPIG